MFSTIIKLKNLNPQLIEESATIKEVNKTQQMKHILTNIYAFTFWKAFFKYTEGLNT